MISRIVLTLAFVAIGHAAGATTRVHNLNQGWGVFQDVRDSGEKYGVHKPEWNPFAIGPVLSPWRPLERLTHLQLLFADQPYFGSELRYFNQAPWWYKLDFPTPSDASKATLSFEGVDYYAKVWLNGHLLGEHEGYSEPFEFEVGGLLAGEGNNRLVVKVSSPWDREIEAARDYHPMTAVVRQMIKGSYEHSDTFIQRDVNPIGIWKPVRLILHDGLRPTETPMVAAKLNEHATTAAVSIAWPVALDSSPRDIDWSVQILRERDGVEVAHQVRKLTLGQGSTVLRANLEVDSPELWSTWDRGGPALYRARLTAGPLTKDVVFGIRTVELRRTADETTFLLNGKRIYLRGTSYWPDLYIGKSDRDRYERDIDAAIRVGINALRIHVHEENPELYDLCDRKGIVVLQDSDLNWTFPTDETFAKRAVTHIRSMIKRLRNHPSIICWLAMNEAIGGENGPRTKLSPGPLLYAEARKLDPSRPVIKNSKASNDLESGDAHDYRGSLQPGRYTDIFGTTEKLPTEFGVDAPPALKSLRQVPRLAERLAEVMPRVAELHDYQYRLIKYYLEHYRMQKYAPNAGYFQFMWTDLSPQSFFGIHDYWGRPKAEGLGGGLRALQESNQPVGIFMEYKERPVAIHAVNDKPNDLGNCTASWTVKTADGVSVTEGEARVTLGPDSSVRIGDLSFPVDDTIIYRVELTLSGPDGEVHAHNVYLDPFHHPERPEGHFERMDHELGMRLWWAGRE